MIKFYQSSVEDKEFMDIWPLEWHQFIAAVLGTNDIELDWEFLKDSDCYSPEEQWELPKEVVRLIEFKDVQTDSLSIGYVALCEYKGVKFLCEQNASPFIFYRALK